MSFLNSSVESGVFWGLASIAISLVACYGIVLVLSLIRIVRRRGLDVGKLVLASPLLIGLVFTLLSASIHTTLVFVFPNRIFTFYGWPFFWYSAPRSDCAPFLQALGESPDKVESACPSTFFPQGFGLDLLFYLGISLSVGYAVSVVRGIDTELQERSLPFFMPRIPKRRSSKASSKTMVPTPTEQRLS